MERAASAVGRGPDGAGRGEPVRELVPTLLTGSREQDERLELLQLLTLWAQAGSRVRGQGRS